MLQNDKESRAINISFLTHADNKQKATAASW